MYFSLHQPRSGAVQAFSVILEGAGAIFHKGDLMRGPKKRGTLVRSTLGSLSEEFFLGLLPLFLGGMKVSSTREGKAPLLGENLRNFLFPFGRGLGGG